MPAKQRLIEPQNKRHGLSFIAVAVALLALLTLGYLAGVPMPLGLWILFGATAAMLMLLGVGKVVEPPVSLSITPESIRYLHRRGGWQIQWDNLVRYDVPRIHRGLELETLPYVGFKVDDIDPVLASLSPRLASFLLFEQRHLLILALRHEHPELDDYSDFFALPEYYESANGVHYRGLKAAFALRTEQLRTLLGYDLYVSASALDREPQAFCAHLQALQASRNQP